MLIDVLILVTGLIVLGVGGESLVQGASKLARSLGIPALVVGLTVVAFGTSAPELAVSITATIKDQDALAIGNVVGSNIANVLLVLGLAALARPLTVSLNVIRVDAPVMLVTVILLAGCGYLSGAIQRPQGVLFVAGLAGYLSATYLLSRDESPAVQDEYEQAVSGGRSRLWHLSLIVIGLVGLKYGAEFIVAGATGIARGFGLSDRLIGMTVVAIGTSLPEIATCVVAARRGQPDIALGNIVGSNIFNVLAVIGIAALVAAPIDIPPDALRLDFPVMIAAAALALPMMWTGRRITRGEGVFLIVLYLAYLLLTVRQG